MPLSTDDTIALLTQEITTIRKRVREQKCAIDLEASKELCPLLKHYNSFSLISKLPDELLLEIFKSTGVTNLSGLLSVTRVCRHWSMTAIQSKSYWSFCWIFCTPWNSEFHVRSGNAPITAEMYINYPKALSNAVKSLSPISPHLHSIKVKVSTSQTTSEVTALWRTWKKLLTQASSNIESISLDLNSSAVIKPFMNSQLFPRLKTLVLSSNSFTWNSFLFTRTLQHLNLVVKDLSGYMLDDLYLMLQKMKELRTLNLEFPEYDDSTGMWSTEEYTTPHDDYDLTVKLQHLQKFTIKGELCLVSKLIGDIEISPDTKLNIDCTFVPS